MISRKVLTVFMWLICLLLPLKILAQEKPNSAMLVDEFNRMAISQLIARLDAVTNQLQAQPTAKIFIFSYRSDLEFPGSTARYLNGIKQYLVRGLRISPEKIILTDGGVYSQRHTQIWIAPAGTAPQATIVPYEITFVDTDSARKFDEYYYPYSKDFEYDDYSYGFNSVNSLSAFAESVKKESGATAYVIVYPQYYIEETEYENKRGKILTRRRIRIDSAQTATRMQNEIRDELTNKLDLPLAKVRIVNGGYRKLRQIELWILPHGVHPPIATPNAFPKISRKIRKK